MENLKDRAEVKQKKSKITIKHRQQLAQYFTEQLSDKVSIQMMLILGGEFMMGAPETELDSEKDERPPHIVLPCTHKLIMREFPAPENRFKSPESMN